MNVGALRFTMAMSIFINTLLLVDDVNAEDGAKVLVRLLFILATIACITLWRDSDRF